METKMNKRAIPEQICDFRDSILENAIKEKTAIKKILQTSEITDSKINLILLNGGFKSMPFQAHMLVVRSMIKTILSNTDLKNYERYFSCFNENFLEQFSTHNNLPFSNLSKHQLIEILERLHLEFINTRYEYNSGMLISRNSKHNVKGSGAVYTPNEIVDVIVETSINNRVVADTKSKIDSLKIFDLACGTGRFYFSSLKFIEKLMKNNSRKSIIRNNLYGIDSDPIAIDILKIRGLVELNDFSIETLRTLSLNIVCKDMLIVNNSQQISEDDIKELSSLKLNASKSDENFDKFLTKKIEVYSKISTLGIVYSIEFPEVFLEKGGFDVIVSNPPYVLLKVNKKETSNTFKEHYSMLIKKTSWELNYFRNSEFYKYSIEGMLNYYRLSIELAIKLLNAEGELGIICPGTIFGDLSSRKLREYMILHNTLQKIQFYPESSRLFELVNQSVAIFFLKKGRATKSINVLVDGKEETEVDLSLIKQAFGKNLEIPPLDRMGWKILNKLNRFNKIKDIDFIRNKRGELDLTLYKKYITKHPTRYKLIRGNSIRRDWTVEENSEYVSPEFLRVKSKDFHKYDFGKLRLAGQQISNMGITKRLNFSFINGNHILANSCNYISITSNEFSPEILIAYLNSFILNWRFKITSTNNHINNYELDELPIPLDTYDDKTLAQIIKTFKPDSELELNIRVMHKYGLDSDEMIYILDEFYPKGMIIKEYERILGK